MDRRPGIVARRSLVLWMLICPMCLCEKLSPDQKAPPFARGSGGLILKTPLEGGGGGGASGTNVVDGVEREETETLKEVDGQLVRVVEGRFAYKSPEGLPIQVKYKADENGNRASFKFGTGELGGFGGAQTGSGSPKGGGGGDSKSSAYLPPNKSVDRSYLPPQ